MNITLRGKSQKGKQRIKDWGQEWEVKEIRAGRLLVQSIIDDIGESMRWVDIEDTDMEIINDVSKL